MYMSHTHTYMKEKIILEDMDGKKSLRQFNP